MSTICAINAISHIKFYVSNILKKIDFTKYTKKMQKCTKNDLRTAEKSTIC